NFSGGVGSDPALAAGQLMQLPQTPQQRTYNPGQQNTADPNAYPGLRSNLSPNGSQEPYGDMVSGQYVYNPSFDSQFGMWPQFQKEESAKGQGGTSGAVSGSPYERRDFLPTPEPSSASPDPAFLVRMRRFNPNDFQPGIDSAAGISTSGPGLPFLFARGSMMWPTTSTSYQPRLHGLTVRATG